MGFFEDNYMLNNVNPDVNPDVMKKMLTAEKSKKDTIWCVFVCTTDKYWQNILTDRLELLFNRWCFDGIKCSFVCYGISNMSNQEINQKLMKGVDTTKVTLHVLQTNIDDYFGSFPTSTLNFLKEIVK